MSGEWSVVSGRWSVVSGRWSVVGGQRSVVVCTHVCAVCMYMPAYMGVCMHESVYACMLLTGAELTEEVKRLVDHIIGPCGGLIDLYACVCMYMHVHA